MKRMFIGLQSLDESFTKLFRLMRIVLLLVCVIAVSPASTYAQQSRTVTGTVTDANNLPLPGVTVLVKGTTIGTITDAEGKFTLSVPAATKSISFSFVGMTSKDVPLTSQTSYSVSLAETSQALGEVVVVGFGIQKKESVVGSIVTATQESLKRSGSPANLAQALTGQLAGVTTIQSTGEPGADDPRILIRAQGTWNNSQPLILVDGVERKMNDIDISEVENISVLKDASATAVFGVKGSEGVILITTKRGQIGKPRLTVEANFTIKEISRYPDKLNAYDALMARNKAVEQALPTQESDWAYAMPMQMVNYYHNYPGFDRNSYIPDGSGGMTPFKYREVFPDVNWPKENLKPFGTSNRVNLNVSGGTNFAKYFGSFSFMHDGDILESGLKTDRPYKSQWGYDRFNFRTNLDFNITKTTVLTVNLAGMVGTKFESFNVNANSSYWNGLYNIGPTAFPPRFDDGYWGYFDPNPIRNPVAMVNNDGIETHIRTQVTTDFALKQNLDFITKGLTVSASLSYDNRFDTSGGIAEFINGGGGYSRWVDPNIIYMKPGEVYDQYVYGSNRASGYFDYVPQPVTYLAESSGGTGFQNNGNDWWGVPQPLPYRRLYYKGQIDYARKFGKHDVAFTGVVDREQYSQGSEFPRYREDWIGRVTYNYDGRYFVEANGAYNGSEKFSKKNRFGFFPSIGASWMLSNEKWLKKDWLDKLKLRYNIGRVGDDNFGERWAYMTVWAIGDNTNFGNVPSSSPYQQYYEQTIGNPNLKWETSQKQNFGFEAALFKNLINLNIDYYTDDRKDIFMSAGQRSVAPFWGPEPVSANLGKTHTQGYEVELKLQKNFGKANVWLNTSFTHAKDKVLYMEDPAGYFDYQKAAGFQIDQTKTGITAGYLNNWDDVYGMTAYTNNKAYYLPGDIRTVDWNGDGIVNLNNGSDAAPYAYPTRPQNTYNYQLGVDVKGWSFMVQFYGVNNVNRTMSMWPAFADGGTYSKVFTATANGWTPTNLDASWKALRISNNTTDGNLYLVDASYFRLKTAEVAYTFSTAPWLKRLGVSSLRVYLNGNNLILWSNIWDDREDTAGDQFAYPLMKRFNMGLTVNF